MALGWKPHEFWRSTPHELFAGFEAHRRYHHGGKDPTKKSSLTPEDVKELRKMSDRALEKERRDHAAMRANGRQDG